MKPPERAGKTDGFGGFDFGMKSGGLRIDLNCDMASCRAIAEARRNRSCAPLHRSTSLVSGMRATSNLPTTIEQALRWKLAIGAHPAIRSREFGRLELKLPWNEIAVLCSNRFAHLRQIAGWLRFALWFTSSRTGAFYNQAVHDRGMRRRLLKVSLDGAATSSGGPAGSPMLDVFREAGFAWPRSVLPTGATSGWNFGAHAS